MENLSVPPPQLGVPYGQPYGQSEAAPSVIRRSMQFAGDGVSLFILLLVNSLLSVITLGVYSFWGRARVRQFVFRNTELDGERFDYHGTGGELLVGFLKVMVIFIGLFAMLLAGEFAARKMNVPALSVLFVLAFYAIMLFLLPYAIVGSQRYQRSRTSWRGVHFRFTGRVEQLSVPFIKGVLLSVVTLGFYSPYLTNTLWAFSLNHTYYGAQRFQYDGDGDGLFRAYLKAFFLGFVTLGLYWVWYAAERSRYLAAHTSFGNARFESTVTGGKMLVLILTNVLLFVFTGGIATPWIVVRSLRFQFDNLVVIGEIAAQPDMPEGRPMGAEGDAMADALGIDTGLDAGFGI